MDPVSIIGFVGASAKVAFDVGRTLYQFSQAAKETDQTVQALCAEVSGVAQSLNSLEKTLCTPAVRDLQASARRNKDKELWQSITASVADCRRTLRHLQQLISESKPAGSNVVQQWVRQFKLDLKTDDIMQLRGQLQTHKTSLHTSLLMLDLYAGSLTSGLMVNELLPRIAKLQVSVDQLNKQQRIMENSTDDISSTIPFLESQAKRVLNSAMTIAGNRSDRSDASVGTGSEYGEPLEPHDVKRIETWASSTPTLVRNSVVTDPGTSPILKGKRSVISPVPHLDYLSEDEDTEHQGDTDDDDSNFVLELVRKYLQDGMKHYEKQELADAEDCFLRAFKKAESLSAFQRSKLNLEDAQLRLGILAYDQQQNEVAEARLLPLADSRASKASSSVMNGTVDYKDINRQLDACHFLAEIYLQRENLESAEKYCMKELSGRFKLKSRNPTLFYASVHLMSLIATTKGDEKEAKMYADMLPVEEPLATPQPEIQNDIPETTDTISSPSVESVVMLPSRPLHHQQQQQQQQQPRSPEPQPKSPVSPRRRFTNASVSTDNSSSTGPLPNEDPLTFNTLIHNGFDVYSKSFDPDAALAWAAKDGNEFIARQLLNGFAVSYVAKSIGGEKKTKRRVVSARSVDKADEDGYTPLMLASSRGHANTVTTLLAFKAIINWHTKTEKRTALQLAALRGHEQVIQILIDNGADIGCVDAQGNTALHLAATKGQPKIITVLMEAGSDAEAKTLSGCTPLHYAVLGSQEASVDCLLRYGAKVNKPMSPPRSAQPTSVTASASDNLDAPPIPQLQQPTALHLAATNGDTRTLALLLQPQYGVNIESLTADGRTPLHAAVLASQFAAVALLLEKGAKIENRDVHGRTALHLAAGNGAVLNNRSPTTVEIRPPTSSSLRESTPTIPTYILILNHLLEQGASTSSRESDGCTPLHVAAFEGDVRAVKILLDHGADRSAKRAHGLTAAGLAKRMGQVEVLRVLQEGVEAEKPGLRSKVKILGLGKGRKLTA